MKTYSTREAKRILKKNGFEYVGCNGDHFKYRRDGKIVVLNKKINKMLFQRLIKENNLVIE